jgi:hypothetical protein
MGQIFVQTAPPNHFAEKRRILGVLKDDIVLHRPRKHDRLLLDVAHQIVCNYLTRNVGQLPRNAVEERGLS